MAGLGHSYQDIHWLFQVLAAVAHALGGWAGVELLQAALWSVALLFSWRAARRWAAPEGAALLVFLAAMASAERFLPRPELVTFVLLPLFYERLQARRYERWANLAYLAFAQLVWANSHGLFVLGPFLAGCVLLEKAGEKLRGRPASLAPETRLLALLLAVTVVTPHGWGSWSYAWLLVTQVGPGASTLMRSLGELSPTFGPAFRSSPAFWFYLVLLVPTIALASVAAWRRRLPVGRTLMVAGLLAASLTGRRNVVLFALLAAPFLAELGSVVVPVVRERLRSPALHAAAALLLIAWAWYPLSGRYYLRMELPARTGLGITPSFFPHGLPAFLDRIGFFAPVFNSNTIGGFYLFHGFPKRLPLTEGRWTAYDEATVTRILAAPSDPSSWQWVVRTYGIEALVLQHASPEASALLPRLPRDPLWRLVWYDHAASLWLRSDRWGHVPAAELARGIDLPAPGRVDDGLILDLFYARTGALFPRIRNLERAVAFGYRREELLLRLGRLQMEARLPEAERTFQLLAAESPRNAQALSELAFFAASRGDLAGASALLRRALELSPGDPDIRANYERVERARPPAR